MTGLSRFFKVLALTQKSDVYVCKGGTLPAELFARQFLTQAG